MDNLGVSKVEAYVGYNKKENAIDFSTVSCSAEKTWDKIYYNIERASSQFKRESAKDMLKEKWEIKKGTFTLPLVNFDIIS
jgi:hypothetical protein